MAVQSLICLFLLAMIALLRMTGGTAYRQLRETFARCMRTNWLQSAMAEWFRDTEPQTSAPTESGGEEPAPTGQEPLPQAGEALQDRPVSGQQEQPVPVWEADSEPAVQAVRLSASGADFALLTLGKAAPPLEAGTVTSLFGNRSFRGEEFHKGLDIGQVAGTPIYALYDGTVTKVGSGGSYGNYLILSHGHGIETLYAHCHRVLVKEGESAAAGQKIALVGNTGDSTGSHLHIELRVGEEPCDPAGLLDLSRYG